MSSRGKECSPGKVQANFLVTELLTRKYKYGLNLLLAKVLSVISKHEAPPKVELRTKTHIDLFVRPNTSTEQKHNILNEWYRKKLKDQIPALIEKWEVIIGVTVNDWGIKQMKTKWGTCNIAEK